MASTVAEATIPQSLIRLQEEAEATFLGLQEEARKRAEEAVADSVRGLADAIRGSVPPDLLLFVNLRAAEDQIWKHGQIPEAVVVRVTLPGGYRSLSMFFQSQCFAPWWRRCKFPGQVTPADGVSGAPALWRVDGSCEADHVYTAGLGAALLLARPKAG